MLGQRLVTKQTGPAGLPIERVYVESGSEIARELYLSLTLNRERAASPWWPQSPGAWTSRR